MMASLNKRLEAQDRAIETLKEDKRKIQRKSAYWKDLKEKSEAKETNLEAKPDTLCEGIIDAINNVVQKHFSKFGQRRIGQEIAKAAWSTDLCRGVARKTLRNITAKELKEKVFSPHRILKFMDLSSGSLNYAAIDILRKIENLTGEKWFRGIIPSPATLRRCARKVEALADDIIPIEKFLSPQGEGIKFENMGKVLEIIHKAFGLTEIGKERALEVAITTDGSMLAHLINLVMVGYKLIDPAAKDPKTGKPLLDPTDPKNSKYQSRDLCFPLMMLLGKETKEMYTANIKPVYDEFLKSSIEGEPNLMTPGYLPFVCACPGDMSCHWKATLVGGGAKVKTRFCINCCCTSDEISTPSEVPCKPCEEKGPDTDFGKAWLETNGND
jgi:hypothetical protein